MTAQVKQQLKIRDSDIDVARGVGMICVVLGHRIQFLELKYWIFLFHMPLFFILSGLNFKSRAIRSYSFQKARSLIVPYISYASIVLVLDNIISLQTVIKPYLDWPDPHFFVPRILFGGPLLVAAFAVFWFAGCLFISSSLFNAAANRWPLFDYRMLATVAGCYAVAMIEPAGLKLPQGSAAVPLAVVFIWAGAALALIRERRAMLIVLCLATVAAMLPFARALDMRIPLNGTIGNPPLAIAISVLIVSASSYIARIPWVARGLIALGQASLTIMFLHCLILIHGRTVISDRYVLLVAALLLPLLVHWLLERSAFTQRFVLGRRVPRPDPAGRLLGISKA
ncbi:acyltransferase family protein [Bosea sp. (in: a-proteobacteria)]|uniref:acyltransferase family protein n=1 Tax=Bosea sp. (in: a-proteobacteria) TaxID=1871050 RepID=UPI003B3B2625